MSAVPSTQRRIRPVTIAGSAAVVLAVSMALPAAAHATTTPAASSWTQTDGTAGHARVNLTETTLTPSSVSSVGRLRNLATPPETDSCNFGIPRSPILVGGNVYDISTGWVSGYKAATGQLLWQHDLDPVGDLSSDIQLRSIAVADGIVVTGGDECDSNSDPNAQLRAYNATTGAAVWSRFGYGELRDLVIAGNEIVTSGSSEGSGNIVTAYSLATGDEIWSQSGGVDCDAPTAMVVRNVVITPLCSLDDSSPELAGFNLATGAQLWHRSGDWAALAGSEHSTNGHLYAQPAGGAITDLNAVSGATRFTLPGATQLIAVDNTTVYAVCGTGKVCGYSEATGAKLWQVANPSTLGAEADGVLYLSDGKLLNAATGVLIKRIWNPTAASLAVGDGRIAVDKPVNSTPTMQLFGLAGE